MQAVLCNGCKMVLVIVIVVVPVVVIRMFKICCLTYLVFLSVIVITFVLT